MSSLKRHLIRQIDIYYNFLYNFFRRMHDVNDRLKKNVDINILINWCFENENFDMNCPIGDRQRAIKSKAPIKRDHFSVPMWKILPKITYAILFSNAHNSHATLLKTAVCGICLFSLALIVFFPILLSYSCIYPHLSRKKQDIFVFHSNKTKIKWQRWSVNSSSGNPYTHTRKSTNRLFNNTRWNRYFAIVVRFGRIKLVSVNI